MLPGKSQVRRVYIYYLLCILYRSARTLSNISLDVQRIRCFTNTNCRYYWRIDFTLHKSFERCAVLKEWMNSIWCEVGPVGRVKLERLKIIFYDGTCTPIDIRISRPMYVALISCVWRKRLLKFIDQSSSDGAIGLTGTKNGLIIRLKAKYARVVLQHCVIKQKSFGSRNNCALTFWRRIFFSNFSTSCI